MLTKIKSAVILLLLALFVMPMVSDAVQAQSRVPLDIFNFWWKHDLKRYLEYGEWSLYYKTFGDSVKLPNGELILNTPDGDIILLFDDDAATLGQLLIASSIDTPNIADNDQLELIFKFDDDSSGATEWAKIIARATDVSDESEDSDIRIQLMYAGSAVTPILIDGEKARLDVDLQLGTSVLDSLGRTLIKVQNKAGSSLAEGDVLVWDATDIEVVADVAPAADHTIADDLSGEGGYLKVRSVCTGTPDAGDSVCIAGIRYGVGADTTTILLSAASGAVDMFPGYWSQVDSIGCNADAVSDGASAINIQAVPVAGVALCDGANTDVAGVAVSTITDNSFGYICINGVCKATVDCGTNAAEPGSLIEGAANGDGVVDAAATTGKNFARALEYCNTDNTKMLVFVDAY